MGKCSVVVLADVREKGCELHAVNALFNVFSSRNLSIDARACDTIRHMLFVDVSHTSRRRVRVIDVRGNKCQPLMHVTSKGLCLLNESAYAALPGTTDGLPVPRTKPRHNHSIYANQNGQQYLACLISVQTLRVGSVAAAHYFSMICSLGGLYEQIYFHSLNLCLREPHGRLCRRYVVFGAFQKRELDRC